LTPVCQEKLVVFNGLEMLWDAPPALTNNMDVWTINASIYQKHFIVL